MDESPPAVPEARSDKPLPSWVRTVVLAAILLLLIVTLQWTAERRVATVRQSAFAQTADAVSAAVAQQALLKGAALQTTAQRIAEAGHFDSVTITDEQGLVVATTDRTRDGQTVPALVQGPLAAKVEVREGRLVAHRAVVLAGDTRVGGLELVARP